MSEPFEPFRIDFDPPMTGGGMTFEYAIIYDAASTEWIDDDDDD